MTDSTGPTSRTAPPSASRWQLSPGRYWSVIVLIIALALWLHRATLGGTLISDDWDHYAMATGAYPAPRAAWQLFEFVRADRSDYRALFASGRLPWWTDVDLQISFLRPLASLFTYADFAWFGAAGHPERAHLHSLAWWVACLVAAAGVLQRVLPRGCALIAFLIFAVDDAHALPVAWCASRAELIAHAFMLAALWAHLSNPTRSRPGLEWLSVALASLALAAGEHALSMFAYFIALAIVSREAPPVERARQLASVLLPFCVYLVLHAMLRYGTRGSAFYADPIAEPLAYLSELPLRAALLCGDLVFAYTADWSFLLPPWVVLGLGRGWLSAAWLSHGWPLAIQASLGAVALLGLAVAAWQLCRARDEGMRALGWLALGALGSIPPVCGVFAMTRLTVAPALGVDALLASALLTALRALYQARRLRARCTGGLLAASILGLHVLLAADRSAVLSELYATWSRSEDAWVRRAPLGGPELAARHVIVLSAHDLATQYCLPYVRRFHGESVPASSQVLLPPAAAEIDVRRVADNAIELRSAAPAGHSGFQNSAYRRPSSAFRVGQHIAAPLFEVEVLAVEAGVPVALRYVFSRSVQDPSYLFLYPRPGGLLPLELPLPGGEMRLPPPAAASPEPLRGGA